MEAVKLEIRPLKDSAEFRAAEEVQYQAWRLTDYREVTPDHLLMTFQKEGGLVLGAFDAGQPDAPLVGIVHGFLGRQADGRLKHCSHQCGVLPAYRQRQVGYHLKLAQRDYVLRQGLDLITWTYDPLETLNGNLNLHKLGAVCRDYRPNLYGELRGINHGLPSDRFYTEWPIAGAHVRRRLTGNPSPDLAAWQAQGVPLAHTPADLTGPRLLIPVPPNFQALKAADLSQARAVRLHTRALFQAAFAAGYTAVDLLYTPAQAAYLLEHDWDA